MPPPDSVAVSLEGHGPPLLLVHGGASPITTWRGLEGLTQRWTLATMYRRGFGPSPPPHGGHVDFAEDADDLRALLERSSYDVIAHSYGGVGAVLAAIDRPDRVRSLTLIEPAIYPLADPETVRLRRVSESFLTDGLDADPAVLREFLAISGAPITSHGPLPEPVTNAVLRAQGTRSPYEANPPLHRLRDAGIRSLVASGGHHDMVERNADAVAAELSAQRIIASGAGHFVAAAPGFAAELEAFLDSVDR